jgi:NFU1 iron-sulfur cluster scaffold homolog, mitochondrial
VETTPNPDSLKFVSRDRSVLRDDQGSGYFFTSVVDAKGAPLVQELLRLPGITGVYLGPEFVSVNKDSEASWEVCAREG